MAYRLFTAPDAEGNRTLWEDRGDDFPAALMCEYDLPPSARHLWPRITRALVEQEQPA